MKWFITILILLNVVCYILVWQVWRKDCKEIGKNNLAVPLKERFFSLFILLTLPTIIGLCARHCHLSSQPGMAEPDSELRSARRSSATMFYKRRFEL